MRNSGPLPPKIRVLRANTSVLAVARGQQGAVSLDSRQAYSNCTQLIEKEALLAGYY